MANLNFEEKDLKKEMERCYCTDPEHDKRQGPLKALIEHATLSPYTQGGQEYLSARGICRECVRHRPNLNGVMSLREAIQRRDERRRLNKARKRRSRNKPDAARPEHAKIP